MTKDFKMMNYIVIDSKNCLKNARGIVNTQDVCFYCHREHAALKVNSCSPENKKNVGNF